MRVSRNQPAAAVPPPPSASRARPGLLNAGPASIFRVWTRHSLGFLKLIKIERLGWVAFALGSKVRGQPQTLGELLAHADKQNLATRYGGVPRSRRGLSAGRVPTVDHLRTSSGTAPTARTATRTAVNGLPADAAPARGPGKPPPRSRWSARTAPRAGVQRPARGTAPTPCPRGSRSGSASARPTGPATGRRAPRSPASPVRTPPAAATAPPASAPAGSARPSPRGRRP